MIDRQRLERMDACRLESDDLHDPRLAPLAQELAENPLMQGMFQRVQAMDAGIREALDDVPLPAGLGDRILARLAVEAPTVASHEDAPSPSRSEYSRRAWLRWSLGLAAAAASVAAIIGGASLLYRPALTLETVQAQVLQFDEEPQTSAPIEAGLPQGYPLSRHIYRLPRTTWRPVYGFLNRSDLNGVAYDMMLRGTSATLYVIPAQATLLPAAPPLRTGMASGNRAVAAWQENGLLYVFVVQGNDRVYQGFIRRPAQA